MPLMMVRSDTISGLGKMYHSKIKKRQPIRMPQEILVKYLLRASDLVRALKEGKDVDTSDVLAYVNRAEEIAKKHYFYTTEEDVSMALDKITDIIESGVHGLSAKMKPYGVSTTGIYH